MKESRSTNGQNMKKSSSYEGDMKRSFAVFFTIIRNVYKTRNHLRTQSCTIAKTRANPSRSQNKANTTYQITKNSALEPTPRPFSFSGSLIHIYTYLVKRYQRAVFQDLQSKCVISQRETETIIYKVTCFKVKHTNPSVMCPV